MKQISEKKVVAALFPNRKESTATFFVLVYGFPKKESVTYLPGQTEF